MMSKKVVSFALSQDSIESLDKASKALGVSRSELIEIMIKKGWHFPKEVEDAVNQISKLQKQRGEAQP
jgi:metal-responsive CopG/Arc/MetJ family transcriptional regulator